MEFKVNTSHSQTLKGRAVLIESDWNLKVVLYDFWADSEQGINRIRLEFKDYRNIAYLMAIASINRIRLEFKEGSEISRRKC